VSYVIKAVQFAALAEVPETSPLRMRVVYIPRQENELQPSLTSRCSKIRTKESPSPCDS
jgi:hypothetical protein